MAMTSEATVTATRSTPSQGGTRAQGRVVASKAPGLEQGRVGLG